MKKPERILHVLGSLNMGGAETLVMNIYRNINRDKYQFDFVVHGRDIGKYEEEIIRLGGKIYHIDEYKVYNHFKYKKIWNDFFNNHHEYNIVHGHMRSTASIYLKIAKKHGLKTISHSHNTSNGKGIKSIIKKVLQSRIKNACDVFMGCSYDANKWLFGEKIANSSNCYVLNNGIDTNFFSYSEKLRESSRKELKLKNQFLVGNVGRLCYQKNQDYLIDIFCDIKKIKNDSKLLIIGSGELKESLIAKMKEKNIYDDVIMLENRSDINALMCAMDCFVFPSRFEGLGIVVIEAQSTGLPCFISDEVPHNVDLTDLIHRIDINKPAGENAKYIMEELKKIKRKIYSFKITKANYSIENTCDDLVHYYDKLLNK